ncbi:MAG: PIN domain-containing protein [Candidatus Sericytochromatia bacterium]|nr:PIN domain-containing protein [Candidatus Tanganyikabacteria bacterium]
MRALLDINVLLALFDTGHQSHGRAREWLEQHIEEGWASCPITQNGFVRIASLPAFPNHVSPAEAVDRLAEATRSGYHEFWPDDLSILDAAVADRTRIHGAKQITDVYLLALAVQHGGCFVTFEDRIPRSAVRGAKPSHLLTL